MKPAQIRALQAQRYVSFAELRGLRARGYVRVSTRDQADGYSPAFQLERQTAFAASHGLAWQGTTYEEYISGRSALKRSQFQQALADAQAGLYDVLLVYHTSRFARNTVDARLYKQRLADAGVLVVFVQQGMIAGARGSRTGERFSELMDEEYSDTLSMLTADGWRQKFDGGDMLGTPYAYRRNRAGRLVPDLRPRPCVFATGSSPSIKPPRFDASAGHASGGPTGEESALEADAQALGQSGETYTPWEVVREVGRRYLSGHVSDSQLADWCNAQGWRTRAGRPFTREAVRYMLESPENAGFATFHRKSGGAERAPVKGLKAPWTAEEFEAIQAIRRQRSVFAKRNPAHRGYPFSGSEHECGERLVGVTGTKRGPDSASWRRVLVCRAHLRGRSAAPYCPAGPVDCERLEALFERLLGLVDTDIKDGDILDLLARLRRLESGTQPGIGQRNHADLKARIARLQDLYELGHVERQEYLARRRKLETDIDAIAFPGAIQAADLRKAIAFLKNLQATWQHAKPATRAIMAADVIAGARLEGRTLTLWPKPEYALLFTGAANPSERRGPEGQWAHDVQMVRLEDESGLALAVMQPAAMVALSA